MFNLFLYVFNSSFLVRKIHEISHGLGPQPPRPRTGQKAFAALRARARLIALVVTACRWPGDGRSTGGRLSTLVIAWWLAVGLDMGGRWHTTRASPPHMPCTYAGLQHLCGRGQRWPGLPGLVTPFVAASAGLDSSIWVTASPSALCYMHIGQAIVITVLTRSEPARGGTTRHDVMWEASGYRGRRKNGDGGQCTAVRYLTHSTLYVKLGMSTVFVSAAHTL